MIPDTSNPKTRPAASSVKAATRLIFRSFGACKGKAFQGFGAQGVYLPLGLGIVQLQTSLQNGIEQNPRGQCFQQAFELDHAATGMNYRGSTAGVSK